MTAEWYDTHHGTLTRALEAIDSRQHWTPHPERLRDYPDDAATRGEEALRELVGTAFVLDQPHREMASSDETSPYGVELAISYPRSDPDELIDAALGAMRSWAAATPEERVGVGLELIARLAADSFQMAYAVMYTTGQPFLMAFQAGGPHAHDRALEAVALAHRSMHRMPQTVRWEKPQGRRDPIVVDKTWRIRPMGIAAAVACSTFPTWNSYPGIFASLVTGNPVIVKPHPRTVLPLALFVRTAQQVLTDAGHDPALVSLLVDTEGAPLAGDLVERQEVALVDYTGSPGFVERLRRSGTRAFVETSGVNSVIVDSTDDLRGLTTNLAQSVAMYSGQMCTTPQNVFVPRSGIAVDGDTVDPAEFADRLAATFSGLLADDQRASDILGAIESPDTLRRIDHAAELGDVVLASRTVANPAFAGAVVRTPVVVAVDAADTDVFAQELFGPLVTVVATDSTEQSLDLATRTALDEGALTWLVHTVDEDVRAAATEAAVAAGVNVSFNLTGRLTVNQSAAFSDLHVTGANRSGNATLTDPAFVDDRFRFVGIRTPAG